MVYTKDLGILKVGQKVSFVFDVGKDLNIVRKADNTLKIIKSCGCTKASWDKNNKQLRVVFRAKNIPKHIKDRGYYYTSKSVTVYHIVNGSQQEERFVISAKIIK